MKRFMKKLAAAAACLCMAMLLTACHGSHQTAKFEIPETLDESKPIEITFWAKNDTNKKPDGGVQKSH